MRPFLVFVFVRDVVAFLFVVVVLEMLGRMLGSFFVSWKQQKNFNSSDFCMLTLSQHLDLTVTFIIRVRLEEG